MEYIHDHADYGFTVSDAKFNWGSVSLFRIDTLHYFTSSISTISTIKKARDDYVKRLNDIYFANLQKVCMQSHHFIIIGLQQNFIPT